MPQMVMHVDGSACKGPNKGTCIGWAVVAHFGGQQHERHGALMGDHNGSHELIALIEGVRLAHESGFAPSEVSLYTDDMVLGHAPWFFHPGNQKQSKVDAVTAKLRFLTRRVYDDQVHHLVLRYLREAHIHWVKGHNFCVDQERADYLAKHAAWTALERQQQPLLAFEPWLEAGIAYYETPRDYRTWYAPFTGPQQAA